MKLPWFRQLLVNGIRWVLKAPGKAAGFEGRWKLTVLDQQGSPHHPRVTLSGTGERLTGTYRAASDGREYPVLNARFAGGRLGFSVSGPEWTVDYDGRLEGNSVEGRLTYDIAGQRGVTDFSGVREP